MIIDGFSKSATEMIIGEVSEYRGALNAHLRIVLPSVEEEGEFVRTSKGVAIEASRFHLIHEAVPMLLETASTTRPVAQIPDGGQQIRVGLKEFKGSIYADIRRFYQDRTGEWQPTPKGISVPTHRLQDLIDLVDRVQKAIEGGVS